MTFYKNPLIGWYLKERLKKIIAIFILILFFYFIFLYNYSHEISYGCKRNDCYSSRCTGHKCRASGCIGDNCKGGDCVGEECEAGDCKGVGCRAGDCYGLNCVPGECIDPTCDGERLLRNKCIPFCKNGEGHTIPRNNLYPVLKNLPNNTILNPNYCSDKKRTNHLTNGKKIHNFELDYINLFTTGQKKYEDVKNADSIQDGKTFILTNDINYISTTPNVYKNYNCELSTKFKNDEITSDFRTSIDEINQRTTWMQKGKLSYPLVIEDDGDKKKGSIQYCIEGTQRQDDIVHNMKLVSNISVLNQIKSINNLRIVSYKKNWMIDQIKGEKLETRCIKCRKTWYDFLDISSHLTNLNNNPTPCLIRVYGVIPIYKNNNIFKHDISSINIYNKNSQQFRDYLFNNVNNKKTFREHHLWIYRNTIGNNQIYSCYWCKQEVKVKYKSLPRNSNMILLPCKFNNDYNHYMYDKIDNNKTVYQKCLKCEKESYPYKQKNI